MIHHNSFKMGDLPFSRNLSYLKPLPYFTKPTIHSTGSYETKNIFTNALYVITIVLTNHYMSWLGLQVMHLATHLRRNILKAFYVD